MLVLADESNLLTVLSRYCLW